jgi:hypothetical protein
MSFDGRVAESSGVLYIEYSQSQLSFIFLKHFHHNNSIYKILTTPSYGGVKEEIYRRMPRNFFSVVPIPAKAKKLGLLSIYKFSLTCTFIYVNLRDLPAEYLHIHVRKP